MGCGGLVPSGRCLIGGRSKVLVERLLGRLLSSWYQSGSMSLLEGFAVRGNEEGLFG